MALPQDARLVAPGVQQGVFMARQSLLMRGARLGFLFVFLAFMPSTGRAQTPEKPEPFGQSPGYALGNGHVWVRAGRIDLRDSVQNEWGLDRESFVGLEGYAGQGYEVYLGGEIGISSAGDATTSSGEQLRDLHFRWGGLNVKRGFPLRHGLSFDAGLGVLLFSVDAEEVSNSGGIVTSDPLADLGYGLQALGDFNWRYRALILGIDARFQYAFDLIDIDYSNFGLGAHLGIAF
jgi:hypothetical protein